MKIHSAGLDWVTLTLKKGDKNFDAAIKLCEKMLADYASGGEDMKPSNLQGYQGFTVGKLFAGWRDDGLMIRASSGVAKYVEEVVRGSGITFRCTRLDLQITAKAGSEDMDYAERMCKEIAGGEGANGRAKGATAAIYKNSHVYSGVTLGSRISECYCRFYDKTREQRGRVEDGLWRFEVEYKRKVANLLWASLMKSPRSYWFAMSLVKSEYSQRGFDMEFVVTADGVERPSTYEPSTADKKLGWLQYHVRSSVQWLIDNGHGDEARKALGL